jgi:hypothetical protein
MRPGLQGQTEKGHAYVPPAASIFVDLATGRVTPLDPRGALGQHAKLAAPAGLTIEAAGARGSGLGCNERLVKPLSPELLKAAGRFTTRA